MKLSLLLRGIAAFAATMSGYAMAQASLSASFTPGSAGPSAAVSATIGYSGVTAVGNGSKFVVCYDSTRLTFVSATAANPPGEAQPTADQAAGALCTAPNDRQVVFLFLSSAAWPSNPAGSGTLAASGNIGTISFTTTAAFTSGSTSIVAREDNADTTYNFASGTGTLSQTITPTSAVFTISSPVNVTEAGATANAVVTCTGAFASNQTTPVAIAFTTTNAAGNFTTSASPVNFTACGGQTQNIVVTPRADDAVVQGAVTGSIVLTAPAAAVGTLGTANTATVNVADNDGPPSVSVAVSGTPASEAGGVLTYTFTRTGNATQLAAALNGVAITPPPASSRYNTTCASPISFAANATTTTCTVTGVDNNLLDGNVNVSVSVAAGSGYTVGSPASATGVINDNEVGVGVTASAATITEGGLATFTLSCTGSGTFAVNYTVNTIATDGAATPASPANLTCGTPLNVTVQTAQNTAPADSRPLSLTITSVGAGAAIVPGQGSATVNVQDDDGPPPTIPTMGAFGLALLGLMMAGIGGWVQRRRK